MTKLHFAIETNPLMRLKGGTGVPELLAKNLRSKTAKNFPGGLLGWIAWQLIPFSA